VFAAVVTATGTGRPRRSGKTISETYATVHGVSRDTGLSDTVVVEALGRLTEAHLIVATQMTSRPGGPTGLHEPDPGAGAQQVGDQAYSRHSAGQERHS
jgi:hypothetical protein